MREPRDSEDSDGSFLERWSRRKRGVETEAELGADTQGALDAEGGRQDPGAGDEPNEAGPEAASEPVRDYTDFDFETLDYDSDYTQFMDKNVSADARQKALRKLWVSNPVLANMDGLDDYCEDYTDAAVCLPKGMMKTAYQFGRGFLDDDEVAAWEALGKPETTEGSEAVVAEAEDELPKVAASEASGSVVAAADEEGLAGLSEHPEEPAEMPDSGPGAGCAAAVKQADCEMLAEFDAEQGPNTKLNSSDA